MTQFHMASINRFLMFMLTLFTVSGASSETPNTRSIQETYSFVLKELVKVQVELEKQKWLTESQKLEIDKLLSTTEKQTTEIEKQATEIERQKSIAAILTESQKLEIDKLLSTTEKQATEIEKQTSEIERQKLVAAKLERELEKQKSQLKLLQESLSPVKGLSTSYVRWGRKVCGGNANVVYRGYAAGPRYKTESGSGSNYLCLHVSPQWKKYSSHAYSGSIYGVEYEMYKGHNNVFSLANNRGADLSNHPAPCAVCNVPGRSTTVMIPARTECPAGWTKEYGGYVISSYKGHQKASYICWDESPETAPGGYNKDQAVIYHTDVHCGTLPCSTYISGRELTCVVCSK